MELVTLDPEKQPEKPVENYDSLIWTERFSTVSDFQLTTGDLSFMEKLPEGRLLSLTDSNEVMQVERHLITRPKNKAQVLTIKGRGWESILDRRAALLSLTATTDWPVVVKTPSDAAYYIMEKICVEGTLDIKDIFPPAQVQFPTPADYLASTGPNRQFTIPRGNLLAAVLQLIQTEARADGTTIPPTPAVVPHGIRAVRPNTAGTAVAIELYTGTDRTAQVYFDGTRDLLDDGSYLFSKEGSATVAYIVGNGVGAKLEAYSEEPSGLERRAIYVDAQGVVDSEALRPLGEMSLADAKPTAIFDGSINPDLNAYTYGFHYGLGDTVRFAGDYSLDRNARVTEYIRSKDATGSKAYPTLTTSD